MLRLSQGRSPFDSDNFHSLNSKHREIVGKTQPAKAFKNGKIKNMEYGSEHGEAMLSPKDQSKSGSRKKFSEYYKSTNMVRITENEELNKTMMSVVGKGGVANLKNQKKGFQKDYQDYYETVVNYVLGKGFHEDALNIKLCLRSSAVKKRYYEKSFSIKNMARRYVYFAQHANEGKVRLNDEELQFLKDDFMNQFERVEDEVIVLICTTNSKLWKDFDENLKEFRRRNPFEGYFEPEANNIRRLQKILIEDQFQNGVEKGFDYSNRRDR